jgi:murein tripeptide amidase MpaA
MKIALHSEKKYAEQQMGWFRGGEDIEYVDNAYKKVGYCYNIQDITAQSQSQDLPKHYYTLSFSYEFEYDFDTVSMAFAQPYTFTDLQRDLDLLGRSVHQKSLLTRSVLCPTIVGTPCDLLTITSPSGTGAKNDNHKRGVILTARVHPGETVASWMMKGAIDFLLSDDKEAECLRDNFVFKIVPMLNPDGVIQGNYRCSLAGCDLNRKYIGPSKVLGLDPWLSYS